MGERFKPYRPDETFLLPPSLRDWLPQGHLAYFLSDLVDELDLSELYAAYRPADSPAFVAVGYYGGVGSGPACLPPEDDDEAAFVRLLRRRAVFAQDRGEDSHGRGLPSAGGGRSSGP